MNPGWVYILTNKSLQSGYLKIGRTINDPSDRAADLSSHTGVATPFEVAYCEAVPDCVEAESLVHQKLSNYRVNNNREFFQVDLHVAQHAVQEVCDLLRGQSPMCHQCRGRIAVTELQRMAQEVQHCKNRMMQMQRQVSFLAHIRRLFSTPFLIAERTFCRLVPSGYNRKVYFWGLFMPLCFAAWIVVISVFPALAFKITVTMVLISALMVTGSVYLKNREEE